MTPTEIAIGIFAFGLAVYVIKSWESFSDKEMQDYLKWREENGHRGFL